ncbi:alpha/beta hydrolase [Kocuria coralli]|uniref:Alpha/beta hydrolase n=1 Tax=Kocuria coralli TaxID=1461025 RepID=A0A5J5L0W4_9MICC|nr:alpha/beta hydrolase [Kocuria coralli]KAA9395502.1 alpha/beta hydrolase [Kocuria coralli]
MTSSTAGHPFGVSRFARTRDGRMLHYMQRGSGEPTVVFESGMGFSRSLWGLVQPVVAQRTRAVVYDRAGFGRSDDSPRRRTLPQLADDLSDLLDALGAGPFILVGHSWGGPIVRTLAARHDHSILGLVLVDPSDEHWATDIRRTPAGSERSCTSCCRSSPGRACTPWPGRA